MGGYVMKLEVPEAAQIAGMCGKYMLGDSAHPTTILSAGGDVHSEIERL